MQPALPSIGDTRYPGLVELPQAGAGVDPCSLQCVYELLQLVEKAEAMLKIVQGVQSPWFGVNLDSGNFTSGSDPYAELAMTAPFAVNAQIKLEMTERLSDENASTLVRSTTTVKDT